MKKITSLLLVCAFLPSVFAAMTEEEKAFLEICPKVKKSDFKRKKKGEIVGQIEIYLTKQLIFSGNLYKL